MIHFAEKLTEGVKVKAIGHWIWSHILKEQNKARTKNLFLIAQHKTLKQFLLTLKV